MINLFSSNESKLQKSQDYNSLHEKPKSLLRALVQKLFLTLLLLTISVKFITAQDLKSVLLDPYYPIDFIGLDFSNSKLIGYQGDYEPAYDVVIRFIPEWNDMFYTQQEKFDVAKFLKKYVVHYSTENMISVNDKIDPSELITNSRVSVQQFTSIQLEAY